MSAKPVVPKERARRDVEESVEHYLEHHAEAAAAGFIDALEHAYRHIGRHPASGSPRFATELMIPGLQCWPLSRYPHLVFYVERVEVVEVWRVLHGRRDIPAWMRDADPA